jgi:hypothetical protein
VPDATRSVSVFLVNDRLTGVGDERGECREVRTAWMPVVVSQPDLAG